jgi:glycerol uptake facilitator-like aquaporin
LDRSPAKNVEPAPFARLARDSAFELILTFVLLFGVATIVRWVIGPSPISRAVPGIHGELWIVGAAVALLLSGLILSPMGRASGAHTNPAISLAMWRFGVFPGEAVIPYAAAQLLGSVIGVIAARALWGHIVAEQPVVYAALQPGTGWSAWEVFATEAFGMAVIVFLIGLCLAVQRLTPFVPWIIGALVGTGIAVLGTATGGSLNPARQFGPAVASGRTHFLWIYLLAPMIGAAFAAWMRQRIQHRREVLTHRLCGTVTYRNSGMAQGQSRLSATNGASLHSSHDFKPSKATDSQPVA